MVRSSLCLPAVSASSGRGAGGEGNPGISAYADFPGFCKAATLKEIQTHGHVLTPGRYVGAEEIEDDGISFEEKMAELSAELYEQMAEAEELDATIKKILRCWDLVTRNEIRSKQAF